MARVNSVWTVLRLRSPCHSASGTAGFLVVRRMRTRVTTAQRSLPLSLALSQFDFCVRLDKTRVEEAAMSPVKRRVQ